MMLLVLDVGNTHTVVGLYKDDRLLDDWRIHTEPKLTEDEFQLMVSHFLERVDLDPADIEQTVISCVVPPLTNTIEGFCRKYLGHRPDWVSHAVVDMPIRLDNPAEVGADRLVNAVAAHAKYRTSLVIIDFGTATTFDCISKAGEYLGGAIAPGIGISAEALFQKASKLPRVELFNPPASVIGKETAASMKSGMLYGYAELVDGMVRRICREMQPTPTIVATGGLSEVIKQISATIEAVEPGLTLEGLRLLAHKFRQHRSG